MPDGVWALAAAAASIALVHTLAGPDHYIPFIAMAHAGRWSRARTIWVTAACGLGHIASSVLLGWLGIALAMQLESLVGFEERRGEVAAWGLIAFGLVYAAWGFRRGRRAMPHTHTHTHADGSEHVHEHRHQGGHLHVHDSNKRRSVAPWALFVVFLLGPCEPLIPLLMVEGMAGDWLGFALIAALFTAVTLATMIVMVVLGLRGFALIRTPALERHAHTFAGLAVLACGLSVRFLGL